MRYFIWKKKIKTLADIVDQINKEDTTLQDLHLATMIYAHIAIYCTIVG